MSEQREPRVWLETEIPKSLYRELRETVARDMGYPSVDAVYASENGDDEMFDWKVDQAVMEALRQWIAGKATSGSSAPSSPAIP